MSRPSDPPPVHVDGYGFLDAQGRYYPESVVRSAVMAIADWWAELTPDQQRQLLQVAELARIDLEVDAAVLDQSET